MTVIRAQREADGELVTVQDRAGEHVVTEDLHDRNAYLIPRTGAVYFRASWNGRAWVLWEQVTEDQW